jgi:hypothetical protein
MELPQDSQDFRDLLSELLTAQVEFLVVGAHALALQGHLRATKDLDIWVNPSIENSRRVFLALAAFGAPMHQISPEEFANRGTILQIGVAPVRIDIISSIEGIDFPDAWSDHIVGQFLGLTVPALGRRALIRNKTAAGRPQDLADVAWLEKHPPKA